MLHKSHCAPLIWKKNELLSPSERALRSSPLTCDEGVLNAEAEALQLLVAGELDPHEAPGGGDKARVLASTEAIDERREAERPVAYLDVIKAALKRRLYVVVLVKSQLDPLSGESFGKHRREEKKKGGKIHEKNIT